MDKESSNMYKLFVSKEALQKQYSMYLSMHVKIGDDTFRKVLDKIRGVVECI